jgi:uncharacterized membrane protein
MEYICAAVVIAGIIIIIPVFIIKDLYNQIKNQKEQLRAFQFKLDRMEWLLQEKGPKAEEPLPQKKDVLANTADDARIKAQSFVGWTSKKPIDQPPIESSYQDVAVPTSPKTEIETHVFVPSKNILDQEWWTNFEENIGKRWMTWVGVIVLFLSVGFFVKYSIDNQWLKPSVRIISSIIFGISLISTGGIFVKRQMTAIGQGLMGGGLAILYVSLFAGFGYYKLIPQTTAFIAMVAVTALGMFLAVGFNAIAISFLATLGGFLTPLMVSSGQDSRDILFAYLLLLDLGVLGVAFFKQWRALDILAFVGTVLMFFGWFLNFYQLEAMTPTLFWLGGFFLTFFLTAFVYHIRYRTPIPLERFLLTISNATISFAFAYWILYTTYPQVLGNISLGMAVGYLLMGIFFRRHIPQDTKALFGFSSLAMIFLTITIPLYFGLNGITLAWAVEGPVLLYLGYRYAYFPVRIGGFIVLTITVLRFFFVHWPIYEETLIPFINKPFGLAMFVPLIMACFCVIHHQWRKFASDEDRFFKIVTGIGAGLLTLIILHGELGPWLAYKANAWSMNSNYVMWSGLLILWSLGVPAFALGGVWTNNRQARFAGLVPAIIASYFSAQLFNSYFESALLFLNLRVIAEFISIASLFAYAFILRRYSTQCLDQEQSLATVVFTIAGFLILGFMNIEINRYGHLTDHLYSSYCSDLMIWSIGSIAFLWAGLRSNRLAYRIMGVVPLVIGLILAVKLYQFDEIGEYHLLLNIRFGVELLAILVAFIYARKLFSQQNTGVSMEKQLGKFMYIAGACLLLVLLSVEPSLYWHRTINDPQRSQWLIQMSLSIVWSAYAAGALMIGFWRKIRPLRFAALGLFGITVMKLVIVDMARVNQIYRIVSFLVLGLLMIGASYLYHRLEKRLERLDTPNEAG